jgi:hypothetical protein
VRGSEPPPPPTVRAFENKSTITSHNFGMQLEQKPLKYPSSYHILFLLFHDF